MRYARRFGHNGGYGSAGYGAAGGGLSSLTAAKLKHAYEALVLIRNRRLVSNLGYRTVALRQVIEATSAWPEASLAQAGLEGRTSGTSTGGGIKGRSLTEAEVAALQHYENKIVEAQSSAPAAPVKAAPLVPIVAPTTPALPMSTAPATQQVPVKPGPSLGSKYLSSLLDGSMYLPLPVVGNVQARLVAAPIAALLLFKVLK